jgi:hypothetical protein
MAGPVYPGFILQGHSKIQKLFDLSLLLFPLKVKLIIIIGEE